MKKLLLVSLLGCALSSTVYAGCSATAFIPKLVVHAARTQDLYGNHWYQIQNDSQATQNYQVCFLTQFGNQPHTEIYKTNECINVSLPPGQGTGLVAYDQWVRDTHWGIGAAGAMLRAESKTTVKGNCTAESYYESTIKIKDY